MHAPKYTKLDANLNPLPDDHPNDGADKHLLVRVEHPMLKEPIVVSAYRCTPERVTFDKAQEIALLMSRVPGVVDLQVEPQVDIPQVQDRKSVV